MSDDNINEDDPSEFRLTEFLPYQLSIASNAVSNRIAQVYRDEFGLRIAEWRIMAILGDAGAMTQRELTERTLMDKVAVNRACKVLEKRGLVLRHPNASDGRSHHLVLTEDGEDMHARIVPLARQIEESLLDAIGDELHHSSFREILEQLREHATRAGPGG